MTRTLQSIGTRYPSFITPLATLIILAVLGTGCGQDKKPGAGPDSTKKSSAAVAAAASGAVNDSTSVTAGFKDAEPADAAAAYQLKLAPRVGDVYSYRITQKSTTEFNNLKATDETVYCFTQKISGVNDDGSFTVEMRYDSISSRKYFPPGVIDSTAKTFAYDTRKKVDSSVPDAAQAKALIGQRVNLTISKLGEVREVSNIEPVLSAILGKMRDSIPPKAVEQLRAGIKVSVFQSVVQQLFLQFVPDSSVHLGSKWVRRDSVPLVLPIASVPSRAIVTYQLTDLKKVDNDPVGLIKISLSTEFPQKKLEDPTGSATIDAASAIGTGDMLMNFTTGFPIRKTTKIDVSLKLTGKAKTGPGKGQEHTLSQGKATNSVVELLDYKPAAK